MPSSLPTIVSEGSPANLARTKAAYGLDGEDVGAVDGDKTGGDQIAESSEGSKSSKKSSSKT